MIGFGHVIARFLFIELTRDELGFARTGLQRQALQQDVEPFPVTMSEHGAEIVVGS